MNAETLSLGKFTEDLASNAPTPGGGAAAALCAALSASLCSMAANLTVGKKRFSEFEADHRRIIEDCETLRQKALELIDEDAKAFAPLSELYSIPEDTDGYAQRIETATLAAAQPPLELLHLCRDTAALLTEMSEKCSALLMSDIACGAALCHAAALCAATNVYVNTRCLKNAENAKRINDEADGILSAISDTLPQLANDITEKLRGR